MKDKEWYDHYTVCRTVLVYICSFVLPDNFYIKVCY